jgi:hypothetical protein
MQGIKMLWLLRQDLLIQRLRLRKIALLMASNGPKGFKSITCALAGTSWLSGEFVCIIISYLLGLLVIVLSETDCLVDRV